MCHTNKILIILKSIQCGEIVWEEWKEIARKGIQLPTVRTKDGKNWDDQNDDGKTKTILEFIGTGHNDLTLYCNDNDDEIYWFDLKCVYV
jgi:hypothetical protein